MYSSQKGASSSDNVLSINAVYPAYLERLHHTENQISSANKFFMSLLVIVAVAFWNIIRFKLGADPDEAAKEFYRDGLQLLFFVETVISGLWVLWAKGLKNRHRIQVEVITDTLEKGQHAICPVTTEFGEWDKKSKAKKDNGKPCLSQLLMFNHVNSILAEISFCGMFVLWGTVYLLRWAGGQ